MHITPNDKGKGIVVMDMEVYQAMSIVYAKGDKEIEWAKLEEFQRELRAHSRALANIFNLGEGLGDRNQTRCYDNISSWACDLPIMRCLPKPTGPEGIPKSRPVVGAAKGLTTAIGDLIADLIEPLAKIEPESTEAQSIEELLRRIQE